MLYFIYNNENIGLKNGLIERRECIVYFVTYFILSKLYCLYVHSEFRFKGSSLDF